MTRAEAIAEIQAKLRRLPDDRLVALADVVSAWSEPSVFSGLSAAERAALDEAVDSLDRGEGVDLDTVEKALDEKLKAAGV